MVLTKYPQDTVCSGKKDEEVGERIERSVHHMPESAARVDLTVCGVCFLEITCIAVRCWSCFSAKTQNVNA